VIVHTVCFTLRHADGSPEELDFLTTGQSTLSAIPGVNDFVASRQIGRQSALRFQFSMRFEDQVAYDAYSAHPAHIDFVETRWEPEVVAFTEFDFAPLEF
jgi:hypothetical protein